MKLLSDFVRIALPLPDRHKNALRKFLNMQIQALREKWNSQSKNIDLVLLVKELRAIKGSLLADNINAGLELDEDDVDKMVRKGFRPFLGEHSEVEIDPSYGDEGVLYIAFDTLCLGIQPGKERSAELFLRKLKPDEVEILPGPVVSAWWD